MSLREDQIQRYGRQILLREVGGAGQRKLLGAAVRIDATGPAAEVAVTYLTAGGSPLVLEPMPTTGFLIDAGPTALNPDALSPGPASITLSTTPVEGPCVVLGAQLAFLPDGACPDCKKLPELLGTPPDPVVFGSAAALLVQRFVLGLATGPVLLGWSGASLKDLASPACARHCTG